MNKTVNISLPEDLLDLIDEAAQSDFSTRSDYIRETLVRRIKKQRIVSDQSDGGQWETVVDLREVAPSGVDAKTVLAATKNLIK